MIRAPGTSLKRPVTNRIPLAQRLTYASLYSAVDNWRQLLMDERHNAQAIAALAATADEPGSRAQIAQHVATERILVAFRQRNYPYFFSRFDALNFRPDASQLTIATDPKAMCRPLSKLTLS